MTHAVAIDDLLRFTHECLQRVGLSSANAREAGLALVTTNATGQLNG